VLAGAELAEVRASVEVSATLVLATVDVPVDTTVGVPVDTPGVVGPGPVVATVPLLAHPCNAAALITATHIPAIFRIRRRRGKNSVFSPPSVLMAPILPSAVLFGKAE
jgi:hypothetical protein